jgi:hypothetical protein
MPTHVVKGQYWHPHSQQLRPSRPSHCQLAEHMINVVAHSPQAWGASPWEAAINPPRQRSPLEV